jgi:hypothetical protein
MKKLTALMTAGIALIFLAVITMNYSCQNLGKKGAEEAMEKALEQETGEDVELDFEQGEATITSGDVTSHIDANAKTWPAGMPEIVPEFKYGKIKAVTTTQQPDGFNWTVILEEVPNDALAKYNDELKARGLETIYMDMGGQGGTIGVEQDDLLISIMGGGGDVVFGVTKHKPE